MNNKAPDLSIELVWSQRRGSLIIGQFKFREQFGCLLFYPRAPPAFRLTSTVIRPTPTNLREGSQIDNIRLSFGWKAAGIWGNCDHSPRQRIPQLGGSYAVAVVGRHRFCVTNAKASGAVVTQPCTWRTWERCPVAAVGECRGRVAS